jgi:endonuclease/exonuclease/phosphatase family metal-dependent hydrolase
LVDAISRTGVRPHTHQKVIAGQTRLRQLDHCFVSADLVSHIAGAWTDSTQTASDHFPLWVDLT